MSQDSESSHNQPLSEVEKRRLESEIAKNEAERIKLTLEAEEVEKRLRRKWYPGWSLIKVVVGCFVASALIANWAIFYFQPMLQTKQINAELENARLAKENASQKQINEQQRLENQRLANDNRENQVKLLASFDALRNSYDSLSNEQRLALRSEANMLN